MNPLRDNHSSNLVAVLKRCGCFLLLSSTSHLSAQSPDPIDIGSRLEPMLDRALIDTLEGSIQLQLHHPTPREVAITFDRPWEGSASGYATVFQDGDIYRLYYRGDRYVLEKPRIESEHVETVCYAQSTDGIHWTKPDLDNFDWPGADGNNIVWQGEPAGHNFCPFIDTNPDCLPEQRYKAIGGTHYTDGLWTFQSADGVHWKQLSECPVFNQGWFDSLNTVFWDTQRQRYSMYFRIYSEGEKTGIRLIANCHSQDFKTWSKPVVVQYPGSPPQEMYTNQILPYYRAPHVLLGFPARYVVKPPSRRIRELEPLEIRRVLLEVDPRCGTDLSDGLFMSSRDGINFHRWDEAFLRPGAEAEHRWIYGDNFQSYGLFQAKSTGSEQEISMLFDEGTWREGKRQLRRYTIRLDGFVSLNALYAGGEMTTRPLVFTGSELVVNYATSAAGCLKVGLLDAAGSPIPGYTLEDCEDLFGDSTAQTVRWKKGSDVGQVAGKPIRIRFVLQDADLYSIQFVE